MLHGASFLIILNPHTHTLSLSISLAVSLAGALGHVGLGELGGERKAHGGLDLARGERALLVAAHDLAGLVGDLVEDVRDELGRDVSRRVSGCTCLSTL
jgi:hypothetical protein